MKIRGLLAIGVISLFAYVATGVVSAQDDTTQEFDAAASRQARIDEYKQRVTDQLTDARAQRIATRCSAAQEKVVQLQTNIASVIQRRTIVYNNLDEKVSNIADSIAAAGADVTELTALIEQMNNKIGNVLTSAESYQSLLADLAGMDCEADVEGFQATLVTAREQRARLIESAKDLKDFVSNDVKNEIAALRQIVTNPPTDTADTEGEAS